MYRTRAIRCVLTTSVLLLSLAVAPRAAVAQDLAAWAASVQRGDDATATAQPSAASASSVPTQNSGPAQAPNRATTENNASESPARDYFASQDSDDGSNSWTGYLGATSFFRVNRSRIALVNDFNTTVFDTSQFQFPMTAGVDLGLRRQFDWCDLDFRFFESNTSTATANNIDVQEFGLRMNTSVSYFLDSVEINARREYRPQRALLIGFRYIGLIDSFSTDFNNGVDTKYKETNNLFGLQVGWERYWLPGERWKLILNVKEFTYGDLAATNVSGNSVIAEFATPTSRTKGGIGLDLAFTANYRLSRYWSVQIGYELLLLGTIATGTNESYLINQTGSYATDLGDGFLVNALNLSFQSVW